MTSGLYCIKASEHLNPNLPFPNLETLPFQRILVAHMYLTHHSTRCVCSCLDDWNVNIFEGLENRKQRYLVFCESASSGVYI